jgi:antitoxin component YwqK of YwqJK toxin-antitoxin module
MKLRILNLSVSAFIAICTLSCSGQNGKISAELALRNSEGKICIIDEKGDSIVFTGLVYDSTIEEDITRAIEKNGITIFESTDVEEISHSIVKNGLIIVDTIYFKVSGKIKEISKYKNGKLDGERTEFYESGKVKSIQMFRNDKQNGITTTYYETGQKGSESNYLNGLLEGESKTYYRSGKVELITNYIKGNFDGPYTGFYENGQEEVTGNKVQGKSDGVWTWYNEDGSISSTSKFKNGVGYRKCDCCNQEYISDEGWGVSKRYSFNVYLVVERKKGGNYCSEGCAQRCGLN